MGAAAIAIVRPPVEAVKGFTLLLVCVPLTTYFPAICIGGRSGRRAGRRPRQPDVVHGRRSKFPPVLKGERGGYGLWGWKRRRERPEAGELERAPGGCSASPSRLVPGIVCQE